MMSPRRAAHLARSAGTKYEKSESGSCRVAIVVHGMNSKHVRGERNGDVMVGHRFPRRLMLPGVLVVIAVVISAIVSAQAQRNPATIDDLLAEIRGLRADLSQTAGATMRMQLLTARLSLQEQRITVLANQRADISTRLAAAVRERSEVEARVKNLQNETPGPGHPKEELEGVLKSETTTLSQRREAERQLRAQETELTGLIATEQGRWTDFNGRLDELERSLPTAGPR